jgi:hypothetical protein
MTYGISGVKLESGSSQLLRRHCMPHDLTRNLRTQYGNLGQTFYSDSHDARQ